MISKTSRPPHTGSCETIVDPVVQRICQWCQGKNILTDEYTISAFWMLLEVPLLGDMPIPVKIRRDGMSVKYRFDIELTVPDISEYKERVTQCKEYSRKNDGEKLEEYIEALEEYIEALEEYINIQRLLNNNSNNESAPSWHFETVQVDVKEFARYECKIKAGNYDDNQNAVIISHILTINFRAKKFLTTLNRLPRVHKEIIKTGKEG